MKNQTALCALILAASLPAFAAQQLPADAVAPSETAAKMDLDAAASSVTQALKDAEGVPARGLTVATHASTLVLTGEVDTEAQRVAALSVAEKAAGGMRISSNIQVKPAQARSAKDQLAARQASQLVSDAAAALKADPRTTDFEITLASTEPNTIVMQGLVPTRENRNAAQAVVSKVKGVSRVDNRLMVP